MSIPYLSLQRNLAIVESFTIEVEFPPKQRLDTTLSRLVVTWIKAADVIDLRFRSKVFLKPLRIIFSQKLSHFAVGIIKVAKYPGTCGTTQHAEW